MHKWLYGYIVSNGTKQRSFGTESKLIYLLSASYLQVVYVMKTTGELLIYFTFGCISVLLASGFAYIFCGDMCVYVWV